MAAIRRPVPVIAGTVRPGCWAWFGDLGPEDCDEGPCPPTLAGPSVASKGTEARWQSTGPGRVVPIGGTGVRPMEDTAKAKDRRGQLEESYEPTPEELRLLEGHLPGHEWQPLGGNGLLAACSCGWHSIESDFLGPALCQVIDHLNTVRQAYGQHRPGPAPGGRGTGQGETIARARELRASAQAQRNRLAQEMEWSSDLMADSAEHVNDREATLRRAKIRASAQTARGLQRQLEQARRLREQIVAAAGALAMIEEELAWVHRDHATRRPGAAARYQRLADRATRSAHQARQAEHAFGSQQPADGEQGRAGAAGDGPAPATAPGYWDEPGTLPYAPAVIGQTRQDDPAHTWYRLPSLDSFTAGCSCGWLSPACTTIEQMTHDVERHLEAAQQAKAAQT